MRKFFAILFTVSFIFTGVVAQNGNSKYFRLDLGAGILVSTGTKYLDPRLLFAVEPKYQVSERFQAGLRVETSPYLNLAGDSYPVRTKSITSFLLTGDHFFSSKGTLKPFIGIGGGIFNRKYNSVRDNRFGMMARLGFDSKPVRFVIEENSNFTSGIGKLSYLGLKILAYF